MLAQNNFSMDDPVNHFTEDEILHLYTRFKSFDDSDDGRIGLSDIVKSRPELGDNPLIKRVLTVFDKDGDGKISFSEFINGLSKVSLDESSKVKFLFEVYDLDKDGFVSNGDLFNLVKMMAGDYLSPYQLQQLVDRTIRDCDTDGDGRLCFIEFEGAVRNLSLTKQFDLDL